MIDNIIHLIDQFAASVTVFTIEYWITFFLLTLLLLFLFCTPKYFLTTHSILLFGILGSVIGAIIGFLLGGFSGYVSVYAVNRFVSSEIGVVLGAIIGAIVGILGTLIAIILLMLCVYLVLTLVSALFGQDSNISIPLFDNSGNFFGILFIPGSSSEPPDLISGFPFLLFIIISIIIGGIAGVKLNQGSALDQWDSANSAAIILCVIFGLLGFFVGGASGGMVGVTKPGGSLVGITYGVGLAFLLKGEWTTYILLGLLGALVGWFLMSERIQIKTWASLPKRMLFSILIVGVIIVSIMSTTAENLRQIQALNSFRSAPDAISLLGGSEGENFENERCYKTVVKNDVFIANFDVQNSTDMAYELNVIIDYYDTNERIRPSRFMNDIIVDGNSKTTHSGSSYEFNRLYYESESNGRSDILVTSTTKVLACVRIHNARRVE